MAFYVYILASRRNGTLYVGSTDSIIVRVSQHKQHLTPGFTSRYGVHVLVWFCRFGTREAAFRRERQIKKWNRAWKIALIEKHNPGWRDLYPDFFAAPEGPLSYPQAHDPLLHQDPLIPAKAGTQVFASTEKG